MKHKDEITSVTLTSDEWNYFCGNSYLSEKYKLHYVATPKAACTSLKWWFAKLESIDFTEYDFRNSVETDRERIIHECFSRVSSEIMQHDITSMKRILARDDLFRYAVVRNPYKRIFSAWQSKLLLREPFQSGPYVGAEFFNKEIKCVADIALAFEGFLEYIKLHEWPKMKDLHWSPQAQLLKSDKVPYTRISQLEDSAKLWAEIEAQIVKQGGTMPAVRRSNSSIIPFCENLVTNRSIELIKEMYYEDFAQFGYTIKLPSAPKGISDDLINVMMHAVNMIRARNSRFAEVREYGLEQKEKHEEKINILRQIVDERDRNIVNLSSHNEEISRELCMATSQVEVQKQELSAYGEQASVMNNQLVQMREDLNATYAQIESQKKELSAYAEQANVMNYQLVHMHVELNAAYSQVETQKKELSANAKQVQVIRKSLDETRNELNLAYSKIDNLQNDIKEISSKLSNPAYLLKCFLNLVRKRLNQGDRI